MDEYLLTQQVFKFSCFQMPYMGEMVQLDFQCHINFLFLIYPEMKYYFKIRILILQKYDLIWNKKHI